MNIRKHFFRFRREFFLSTLVVMFSIVTNYANPPYLTIGGAFLIGFVSSILMLLLSKKRVHWILLIVYSYIVIWYIFRIPSYPTGDKAIVIDTYLISYPESPRLPSVREWFRTQELSYTLVNDIDHDSLNLDELNIPCRDSVDPQRGPLVHYENFLSILRKSHIGEWLLVLEDDVELVRSNLDLSNYLESLGNYYENYDFIWLDNRAFFQYPYYGFGCGLVGSLIRSSSALKIASLLEEHRCTYLNWTWDVAVDLTLVELCQDGRLVCVNVPILRESGISSTIDRSRKSSWYSTLRIK